MLTLYPGRSESATATTGEEGVSEADGVVGTSLNLQESMIREVGCQSVRRAKRYPHPSQKKVMTAARAFVWSRGTWTDVFPSRLRNPVMVFFEFFTS